MLILKEEIKEEASQQTFRLLEAFLELHDVSHTEKQNICVML